MTIFPTISNCSRASLPSAVSESRSALRSDVWQLAYAIRFAMSSKSFMDQSFMADDLNLYHFSSPHALTEPWQIWATCGLRWKAFRTFALLARPLSYLDITHAIYSIIWSLVSRFPWRDAHPCWIMTVDKRRSLRRRTPPHSLHSYHPQLLFCNCYLDYELAFRWWEDWLEASVLQHTLSRCADEFWFKVW
jgi:hypothetical protein